MSTPALPPIIEPICLITGASGFVGRALLRTLQSRRWNVRAASRQPVTSVGHALAGKFEVLTLGPVDANTEWEQALSGAEYVVHLAARVHIMTEANGDPLADFRAVNAAGTLHLARQAAAAGVSRFVFLSSVKVNGEKSAVGRALREVDTPAPQDPYAISKHEAEQGLRQIAAETGMEVVIIRPPLVYGPGVRANFAALMGAIARGVPLPLRALRNRRSLVGLDNLADFIMTCLTHSAAANETFLVSDGEDLSTTDLARRLGAALHRPARLIPVPATWLMLSARMLGKRAAAERLCGNLQVDISKAKTLLGWTPPLTVDEGLRRAAAGYGQDEAHC